MSWFAGGLVNGAAGAAMILLSLAFLAALVRLILGPRLADRVVALDLISTIAVGVLAASSVITGERSVLDAALIVALIAFLGTVAFASYLERGGPR
jgi:multicomponent Na+:H+ antiporter subunit F